MSAIGSEKYVSITTFERDGTPVSTPVWIADLGERRVGFTTQVSSWKAKRIAADPRVELQPCNMRGEPREGTPPVVGTAKMLSGAAAEPIRSAIRAKYGLQVTLLRLADRVKAMIGRHDPDDDGAVEITLPPSSA